MNEKPILKDTAEMYNLIKSCVAGDRKAQNKLYEQYKVYLFGVCMRYSKSRPEAEDILQEGFYKILKNLGQFANRSSLKSWMHRVVVNTALMHVRKHHKMKFDGIEDAVHEQDMIVENTYPQEARAQRIIRLIRQLPIEHQMVFNLRAMDGYSFAEIAKQLDGQEATMRSKFLRARKKLQELLTKEFESER